MLLYAAGEIIAISPYVQLPNFLQKEKKRMGLKHLCRQMIRNHLLELDPHAHLFGRVPRLGLPSLVTDYLLYHMTLEPSEDDEKQDTFFGFTLYGDTDDDSSRDKDDVAVAVNDDSDDDYIATEEERTVMTTSAITMTTVGNTSETSITTSIISVKRSKHCFLFHISMQHV